MMHNGSFWFDSLAPDDVGLVPESMPSQVDVAIIGGGYTGLSTALHCAQAGLSADFLTASEKRSLLGLPPIAEGAGDD